MTDVDKAMARVAAIVENSAGAAEGLAREIARLQGVIARFRMGRKPRHGDWRRNEAGFCKSVGARFQRGPSAGAGPI
jgi:hypothetical protein